ncbi:MAG: twin-arginine translocase subunit TatC [Gemmatimonadetes bacterium]|nr:twin-arginine translocase subunit TatC [Gemmatimonadota bacterium]
MRRWLQRSVNPRGEMPFLDHLEELRWRVIWSLIALFAGLIIGLIIVIKLNVLGLLIAPIQPYLGSERLSFTSPSDPFWVTLQLALVIGLLLSFPFIAYHLWAFFSPALEKSERQAIVPALYLGLVLFAGGVAMGYFVALPVALRFLMSFQTQALAPVIMAGPYLAFVTKLLLAFGAVFELPVVILVLSVLGLVTPQFLASKRRHALVGITILASVITPGDVIVLTAVMMVPLYFLYELSILLSRIVYRRKRKAEEAAENTPPGDGGAGGSMKLTVETPGD